MLAIRQADGASRRQSVTQADGTLEAKRAMQSMADRRSSTATTTNPTELADLDGPIDLTPTANAAAATDAAAALAERRLSSDSLGISPPGRGGTKSREGSFIARKGGGGGVGVLGGAPKASRRHSMSSECSDSFNSRVAAEEKARTTQLLLASHPLSEGSFEQL